jgi:hypothetical protein
MSALVNSIPLYKLPRGSRVKMLFAGQGSARDGHGGTQLLAGDEVMVIIIAAIWVDDIVQELDSECGVWAGTLSKGGCSSSGNCGNFKRTNK